MLKQQEQVQEVKMSQLLFFFLPLGVSASLVTISHVIINSTLARSAQPELMIASYAIAMSVFGITERPALLLRQTCSALVRDRVSFRSMLMIAFYLILGILILGLTISYTPLGKWLFLYLFGIDDALLAPILDIYRVLIFVTVFSGIRCLYQGVIISNMRTKWLTIGMVIRLISMYLLSLYFIQTNQVNNNQVGAMIFLCGMAIEALVSFAEGRLLVKKMPEHIEQHSYHSKTEIFQFYRPLLYSSFIAVFIGPAINAMLGKTADIKLAIASYAIALSLTFLVSSFFTYIHQIVLNFYHLNKSAVFRFTLLLSSLPCIMLGILAYTSAGPWFMQHIMGVNESLMTASLQTLRVFMIMTLIFPWLDYCNGLIMLSGQTKSMIWSQTSNIIITILTLALCVWLAPGWNGAIGALAQSLGFAGEIAVLLYVLKTTSRN
jgi:hypothetical protein